MEQGDIEMDKICGSLPQEESVIVINSVRTAETCSSFGHKYPQKKSHEIFFGLLLIAHVTFVGVFIGSHVLSSTSSPSPSSSSSQSSSQNEVCRTEKCMKTAGKYRQYMNPSVDPCHDIYQFACGSFKSRTVTDDRMHLALDMWKKLEGYIKKINGSSIEPLQQMKRLYQSCMYFEAEYGGHLKEVEEVYEGLTKRIFKPENSIAKTLAAIRREAGISPIFAIYVLPSYDDDTSREIVISKYIRSTPKEQLVSDLLTTNQTSSFKKLLDQAGKNNLTSTKVERMTLKELQKFYINSSFSWIEFTKVLFKGLGEPEITEDTVVNVEAIQYLETVGRILASTPIDEVEMYLKDQVAHTLYTQEFLGLKHPEIRTYSCVSLVEQHMPFAIGHIFVSKIDDDALNKTIAETRELMKFISIAFKNIISRVDWMDSKTKAGMLKKVDNVKVNIGYLERLRNSSEIDLFYKGLNVTSEPFPQNLLNLIKWSTEKELKDYFVPSKLASDMVKSSPFSPSVVNAYYLPWSNQITIPVAFMQPPYTGLGLRVADFGAMGFVLGHELAHGFTARWRYRDGIGKLNSWWSTDADIHFKAKEKCFRSQYEGYWGAVVKNKIKSKIDSEMQTEITFEEHIADNVGIRVAFAAYKLYISARGKPEPKFPSFEKYTSEQMFYLSMAHSWCSSDSTVDSTFINTHGPNALRVLGALGNDEEFSRVWGCSKRSKMNREDKCVLYR